MIQVPCNNCGEKVDKYPADIKRYDQHFCSRDCQNAYQTGENHSQWRGGHAKYYGENWHKVRDRVLERDNETCQFCGRTSAEVTQLNVHHIKPIKEFDRPEDANTVDNLVCLCNRCHAPVENNYGVSEQTELFFGVG